MAGMRYQPQGAARLNTLNPLTRGMKVAINAGSGVVNLVNNRILSPNAVNGASLIPALPSHAGLGWTTAGRESGWVAGSVESEDLVGDEGTILVMFTVTESVGASDANNHCLFIQGGVNPNGTVNQSMLGQGIVIPPYLNQRGLRAQWRLRGYNTLTLPGVAGVLETGQTYTAISTYQRLGLCELFLNGKSIASATAPDQPLGPLNIGTGFQVARSFALGPASAVLACSWDRKLTQAEIDSVTANPWQLLAAEDDFDYLSAAAVQHVIAVEGAALAVTGGQARMRVSRRLIVTPASLAIAAGPVAMRASRRISVAPAGLVMAAGPVALSITRRIKVEPAAMVLTGGPVEMRYGQKATPNSYTLPVSPAAITIAGGEVGMRVTRRLSVAPAGIVIEGQQVAFVPGARAGVIDASKVPPSRTVKFVGGQRVVIFSGGVRVATFNGGKRTVRF